MEYEKESSWSWRKFTLDIAKVVATVGVIATAGVVYAYYNGYNFELESNPEKELCASQTIKILKKRFSTVKRYPRFRRFSFS